MKLFYLALASGSQCKTAKVMEYPYILISHATKLNSLQLHSPKLLFADCGGFYSSFKHKGYKNSDEDYLEWVKRIKADFFALRDYPCELQVLKRAGRSVNEHINLTLQNHLSLLDKMEDINAKPIPVIQGWELGDYLHCLDMFRDHGLITDYMAIGTLCRRSSQKIIEKLITGIKDNLPSWVKLHGFGVSLNALKRKAVWDNLYSSDSGAFDFASRWKALRGDLPRRESSEKECRAYLDKLEGLRASMLKQTTLSVDREKSW